MYINLFAFTERRKGTFHGAEANERDYTVRSLHLILSSLPAVSSVMLVNLLPVILNGHVPGIVAGFWRDRWIFVDDVFFGLGNHPEGMKAL
jgi:hypothetical protein